MQKNRMDGLYDDDEIEISTLKLVRDFVEFQVNQHSLNLSGNFVPSQRFL